MRENAVISRRDGWFTAWVDKDLIMMNGESSVYLNLNGSGGRIWELLEEPRRVGDLCQALAREYDILPQAARPEVEAFLEEMLSRKAIDVRFPAMA